MKCLIIDDEPIAREGIQMLVDEIPYLETERSFGNGIEALEYLYFHTVDLIFLDIEMPGMTGLEFLKQVKNPPFVILTTAYQQYALEAFELDVIDYLVKPIRVDRFVKAINKVKEIVDLKEGAFYEPEPNDNEADDFVFIRSDRKLVKLFYNEVSHIKGLKDYVMIYTSTDKYLTAMNIKRILSQLPSDKFIRTSKSYIINTDKIKSISHDTIFLEEIEIPLGNSYKEEFLSQVVNKKLIDRKK